VSWRRAVASAALYLYFLGDDKHRLLSSQSPSGAPVRTYRAGPRKTSAKDLPPLNKKGEFYEAFYKQTVVLTGAFAHPWDHPEKFDLKCRLRKIGIKAVGSLSGKTKYLVTATDPGWKKKQDAEKMGVEIISEADFLKLINISN